MVTKPNPIGYLDDNALEAQKALSKVKYLHEVITINDEDVEHATYFKKPTLDHLQVLTEYSKKGQELKGLEVLFNTCRVAGSDEVLVDDEMKMSAYKELGQIFKRRDAVVKKR